MSKEDANSVVIPINVDRAMTSYESPRQTVYSAPVPYEGPMLSRLGVDNYCLDRIGLRSMSPQGEVERLARLSSDPRAKDFQAMGSRVIVDPALLFYLENPDELLRMERKLAKWADSSIGLEQEYWNHRIENFRALVHRIGELTGNMNMIIGPTVPEADVGPPHSVAFFGRDGAELFGRDGVGPTDTHIERAAFDTGEVIPPERTAAPVQGVSARMNHKHMPVHDLTWTREKTEEVMSNLIALLSCNGYKKKSGGRGKMLHSLSWVKAESPTITVVTVPGHHLILDLMIDGKQAKAFSSDANCSGFGDPDAGIPASLLKQGSTLTHTEASHYIHALSTIIPTVREAVLKGDTSSEAPTVLSIVKVKPDTKNCVQFDIRTCPNGLRLNRTDSWKVQLFIDGKIKASSKSEQGTPLTPQLERILIAVVDSGRVDDDKTVEVKG